MYNAFNSATAVCVDGMDKYKNGTWKNPHAIVTNHELYNRYDKKKVA